MRRFAAGAIAAIAALAVAVPAGAARAENTTARTSVVRVQLMEWMLMPSKSRVAAGKVVFTATNTGKVAHDLVVLRTSLAPGKLPVAGARAKEVGLVGKTPAFGAGQTRRLTLTLRPGRYVLVCNVPGHYAAGMRTGFRVD